MGPFIIKTILLGGAVELIHLDAEEYD